MMKIAQKSLLKTAFIVLVVQLFRTCKMSIALGKQGFFFSAINLLGPLSGFYGGIGTAAMALFSGDLWNTFFMGKAFLAAGILNLHLPTLCAAAYWSTNSFVVRLLIPIACMVAFWLHPVGGQAFYYALWWLIPVGIYFYPRTSYFATALGSTFVAHAVGSVLWVYLLNIPPQTFATLMPIVPVERFVFALGMTAVCYAGDLCTYLFAYMRTLTIGSNEASRHYHGWK